MKYKIGDTIKVKEGISGKFIGTRKEPITGNVVFLIEYNGEYDDSVYNRSYYGEGTYFYYQGEVTEVIE